ncbi:heparan-alpha-glucosaminide N-acetyltransferase domain-containing protein [Rapidithrix thailandica]|uniref:Heparan-alpha-glucosaminide N-acetyltransferase domain-containing protein n=1 Tax=Rapidithrix thailandica TaxID=413964 RepID=A0AAW9SKN5_9BACT
MEKRIIGIDVARGLAIIGMILVNFKIAFGGLGNEWIRTMVGLLEGKAAATFVVLAGVGIAFISNSAVESNNAQKLTKVRARIFKRALFLFIVGLIYLPLWPADILHFYGVYMLITLLVLPVSNSMIVGLAVCIVALYPLLMALWNYDAGWNYETLEYTGFWTVKGFLNNLFYNGFHPVFPWVAFMLVGVWFGRQDLRNERFLLKSAGISSGIFVCTVVLSRLFIAGFSFAGQEEVEALFGTSPMPPLPFYMISGSSIAITVISVCILLSSKFEHTTMIQSLKNTGQLALTFYVAHVVIGMVVMDLISQNTMGAFSIEFSLGYALVFSVACIVFANVWKRKQPHGPLEGLMRKVTG